MRVAPVKKYGEPKYPTSMILEEHPELLKLVPKRWQGNTVVLTALAGICFLSTGLRAQADSKPSNSAAPDTKPAAPAVRITPIFEHGDGYGAFGCRAVNPPVFLSEEEARAVIMEEAKRAGITFKTDGQELKDINVPPTSTEDLEDYIGNPAYEKYLPKERKLPLVLDGYDEKLQISYEYVSESDFDAWQVFFPVESTARFYDMKGTASKLKDALAAAKPDGTHAVFYDPCMRRFDVEKHLGDKIKGSDYWEVINTEAKALAREEIRNQVKDFISWLKTEGII